MYRTFAVSRFPVSIAAILMVALACTDQGSPEAVTGPAAAGEAGQRPAGEHTISGRGRPELIALGERLFFEETFGGNGRTCGTCHPTPTLVLTPADIAILPADDPFFAGTMDFEPDMAEKGMIRYPLGGNSLFEPDMVVFRAIPTIRNVRQTGPFTTDGRATTLQEQAAEAALLHLLDGAVDRPGERMPTDAELDAIAAFEESMTEPATGGRGIGRLSPKARQGQKLFFGKAQCTACHKPPLFTDNRFHNIVAGEAGVPAADPGRCRIDPGEADCWSGSAFNTPQLRGVGRTAPFFHDNSLETLEAVVDFYNSARFSESPAARRLGIPSLELTAPEAENLVAFLAEI